MVGAEGVPQPAKPAAAYLDTQSPADRSQAARLAARATAEALGNTVVVARASYIDPRIFTRYARGQLLDLTVAPETAIRRLLAVPGSR